MSGWRTNRGGVHRAGHHVAANLQMAGFKLVVHDMHKQAASRHLSAAKIGRQPARGRNLSLPEPPVVEAAVALADAPVCRSAQVQPTFTGPEGLSPGEFKTAAALVWRRCDTGFQGIITEVASMKLYTYWRSQAPRADRTASERAGR